MTHKDDDSESEDSEASISHIPQPVSKSQGLDFISPAGYPDIQFGYDSTDDDAVIFEDDEDENLDPGKATPQETRQLQVPVVRRRRSSASKVTLYIHMEYCEGKVRRSNWPK